MELRQRPVRRAGDATCKGNAISIHHLAKGRKSYPDTPWKVPLHQRKCDNQHRRFLLGWAEWGAPVFTIIGPIGLLRPPRAAA